jgi:hypothetical protein
MAPTNTGVLRTFLKSISFLPACLWQAFSLGYRRSGLFLYMK